VPLRPKSDIGLIEIRNGGVRINGSAVSSNDVREKLGPDGDLVLRLTYLDTAAQQELAGKDPASAKPDENTSGQGSGMPERGQEHKGDRVHIGGGVTVGKDEIVEGDVVAIGGPADVDGEVTGDVTAIGGPLTLGPDAIVRGDAVAVGGSVNRSPGARVDGQVTDVGMGAGLPLSGIFGRGVAAHRQFSRAGGLLGTVLRVTLLILGALVVVVLGGQFVQTIADRAASEPLRAGLAGLLAEVLFIPLLVVTVVVLAVSIIGIPLLLLVPFAVVLAGVLMFIGFTGVACEVGHLLSERFGIRRGPYATVALGVVAVVGIPLIAKIISLAGGLMFGAIVAGPLAAVGYLVEYIAWTMGIGALILAWGKSRQSGSSPAAAAAAPVADAGHAG
jgi:hypothetical protein